MTHHNDKTVEGIHMKVLARASNAKDLGDLTVVPMGFFVSIIKDALQQERANTIVLIEGMEGTKRYVEGSLFMHQFISKEDLLKELKKSNKEEV